MALGGPSPSGGAVVSADRAPELGRSRAQRRDPDLGRGHLEGELRVSDGRAPQLIRAPVLVLELDADSMELAPGGHAVRCGDHEVGE